MNIVENNDNGNENECILLKPVNNDFSVFVKDAINITKKCLNLLFKICNITKKHTFLFLKDINNEIIKDIIKND